MSAQEVVLVAAIMSTLAPVVATLVRGGSRYLTVFTLLGAVAVSTYLYFTLRLIQLGSGEVTPALIYALMATPVPMLLVGYLCAIGFGRANPDASFVDARRTFILLGVLGAAFVAFLHRPTFIGGYAWLDGRGTIHLGFMGKAYLTYLLIGIVVIGYNVEKTYRVAAADNRHRLRLPIFGIYCGLFYLTFILTSGMLYSSLGVGKLVAAALPIGFLNVVVTYGYLRGSLSDVAAPVSRNIVYSSFTALAAGLFVAAMGAAAQIAAWTQWSPDEILVLSVVIVALLTATLFLLSNRFQRQVRRFIDRNFYVNRYDYRTQWYHVTEAFMDTTDRDSILKRSVELLENVFLADEVTIALVNQASGDIRPVLGKGVKSGEWLPIDSALSTLLANDGKAVLVDRKPDDFTFIPVYAENSDWLDATASQIVVPLMGAGSLMGTIGLERKHGDDPFTFEDVALLDSIGAHISSTLRADQLSRELADTREMDLMSQWSSMILHDLKNYLSPLRMVAKNLDKHRDKPEVATICARDIERVTDKMGELVNTLGEIRVNPREGMEIFCPNELVEECLDATQVRRRTSIELREALNAKSRILGNRAMLCRVIENLISNAVEAMPEGGRLSVDTRDEGVNGDRSVAITVADTGVGIPEEFLRNRMFRPFATTKDKGLGLGLYQSRAIVQAHGGKLTANSRPGEGSRLEVLLAAAADEKPPGTPREPRAQSESVKDTATSPGPVTTGVSHDPLQAG
jgi:putative PEP-CTERM system histidine kinase